MTEIIFALGAGARVIAVDSTSRFPTLVEALPRIGYMRALASEELIALVPDLLLMSEEAGPPQAVAVLRAARAPIRVVPDRPSADGVRAKILAVAEALGLDRAPLAAAMRADWAALDAPIGSQRPRRAIFILSASRGAPLVSGEGTHADAMLRAAGATNVIGGFTGYAQQGMANLIAAGSRLRTKPV